MGDRSQADALAAVLSPEDVKILNRDFAAQVQRYNLHYDCRHCVHLDTASGLCSVEYPNHMLWDAVENSAALTEKGDLVFCKYFELH